MTVSYTHLDVYKRQFYYIGSFFRCDRVGDRYLFVYESNCGCETADSYAGSFYSGGQHLDDARQYETEEARAGRLEGISG